MAFSKARRLSDFIAADGTVPATKFATGTITSAMIADTSITPTDLHTSLDLTGKTVTVATASGTTNTTAAASTAFVQQELTTLIGGAPSTLNDLNELAAAINDDANYNSTLTTALATKLPLAGGTLTGSLLVADDQELQLGNSADIKFKHHNSGYGHLENTGILYIDAEQIQLRTDNSDVGLALTLNSSHEALFAGKVGIGTIVPYAKLSVKDGTNINLGIKVGQTDATAVMLNAYNDAVTANIPMEFRASKFNFENGNVGIGTTDPDGFKTKITSAAKGLFVQSGSGGYTSFGFTGDAGTTKGSITSNAGRLYFGSENTGGTGSNGEFLVTPGTGNVMLLHGPTGYVGIGTGTTTPIAPLEVHGGAGMTGGWGRTALLAHNFPVLVFQSKYSTDAFAGIGYDNSTGLKFYVNSPTADVTGNSAANFAMTILDNKNVGIGTQNPDTPLHVFKGESGAPAPLADSVLILENNTHNYLQFLSPSNTEAGLIFGDVQNDNTGGITYNHSTDKLAIIASGGVQFNGGIVKGARQTIHHVGSSGAITVALNNYSAVITTINVTTTGNSKLLVWAHSGQILKATDISNPTLNINIAGNNTGGPDGNHYWYNGGGGSSNRVWLTVFGMSGTLAAGTHTINLLGGSYAASHVFNYQNQNSTLLIMEVGA